MIGVLAVAAVVGAVTLVGVGLVLHRDLAQINEQLARSGHQPEFNRWLDQLWSDVEAWHGDHAKAADKRLRDIEAAVTHTRQGHGELARYVDWMVPWVQRWASESRS